MELRETKRYGCVGAVEWHKVRREFILHGKHKHNTTCIPKLGG